MLANRTANNLPHRPGGRRQTSVVRGLAQRIAAGEGVASLDDRLVIEIEPALALGRHGRTGRLAAKRLGSSARR
ncbi:MAG: hypothetical protein IPQ09_22990 [Myxococcales bacterium]|nr:hypothetical protein [Myxococcales bacterium]